MNDGNKCIKIVNGKPKGCPLMIMVYKRLQIETK
jgi:hypothetical protein